MQGCACLFVLVLIAGINAQSSIQDIKNRIVQSGHINAQSIGPTLAGFLSTTLRTADIAAFNISIQITSNELTVTCDALVWQEKIHSVFYFYQQATNDIEMAFTFSVYGPVQQLYTFVTGQPAPEILQDFRGTGSFTISFASSTVFPIAKGLTIAGQADIVNGTLLKAIHWFQPSVSDLQVSSSLFFPIFGQNPLDIVLTLAYSGDLQLSKTLTLQSLTMTVDVPAQIKVSATLQSILTKPSGQQDVLQFQVSGQFLVDQQQITLQGAMTGTWTHPLGISWLSVTSATATLVLGSDSSQVFSITAQGAVSFSSQPVTLQFSIGGPNFNNILIAAENIPVSKTLARLYSDITGKSSVTLSQVTVTGTASIAIATYNTGKYQEGFSIVVNSQVIEGGSLMKAVRLLRSDASPSTFTYVATLYVPIFTEDAADFSLVETGAFSVTKSITCDDYTFAINLGAETSITIDADMEISGKISAQGPLKFKFSGDWQESSEQITFSGTLESPWVEPFGLSWMVINSGSVDFSLGGSGVVKFDFTGSAQLAFDLNGPVSVTASIGGPDLENALFSVSGIPISSMTVDLICYYLLGMSQAPSEIKSLNPKGVATVSIATFDSSVAREGFTFTADVTLQDQGEVYKIAKFFNSDPTTITFQLNLYVSVFQQNPELEFSVSENGQFPIATGVTVNSYSIDVVLSAQPSFRISSEVAVQFKREPNPLVFDTSANWQEASSSLTLSGSMSGAWVHPFGQKWLQINNVAINLALGAPTGFQSLSVSGAGNFTFGVNSGTASVSVSLANDFDVTLSATLTDHWTLTEVAESIIGMTPPSLVGGIKQTGDVSLTVTLSTASGVSLDVSGTVTGDLQKEVKKAMYWFGADPGTLTFSVSLNLPIFSANPAGISIALSYSDEIQLSKHLWFESITFSIDAAPPVSIALDAKIKAEFQSNPTLFFEANGAFKGDGSVLLWGAMEGTWVSPFGIPGFSLSNVIIEFGFSPSNCAVDACISDLGLGLGLTIGNTQISFDGNAAAPDFWNVFLAGSISTSSPTKTLPVASIIQTWNSANPNAPVSQNGIPSDWSLSGCSFYFAPVDGNFGPIHYKRGFGVTASMTLLSMNLFVSLNCTDSSGFSCNFAFDVHVTIDQFTTMIKKELGLMYPNRTDFEIFTVKNVRLSEWSQKNVAHGTKPRWTTDIVVLGKPNTLDFRVEQDELATTFHQFFVNYLKHIFG